MLRRLLASRGAACHGDRLISSGLASGRRCYSSSNRLPAFSSFAEARESTTRIISRSSAFSNDCATSGELHYSSTFPTRRQRASLSTAAIDDLVDDANVEEQTVEQQYSRKTPVEHVLLRPGMYVGPCERLPPTKCWVLAHPPGEDKPLQMVQKEYGMVPALNKIFDEIVVNASDNRLRPTEKKHSKPTTRIDVTIHRGDGVDNEPQIQICNNGRGIPVQLHKKEGLYIPELIFGHLLTGSNFSEAQKKVTGGRHGYGAKLTNIFSKRFVVETADAVAGLVYRQEWTDNMSTCHPATMTPMSKDQEEYTRITFVPDLEKLTHTASTTSIPQEDYDYMCRRVIDIAGCSSLGGGGGRGNKQAHGLEVTLNSWKVPISGFESYTQLYRTQEKNEDDEELNPICFDRINSRWEVGIGKSETGSFDCVSFVNGMATSRGGTHVNAIVQQVGSKLIKQVTKQVGPELAGRVTPAMVRRHLFVSCNSLVENPTFDSQMKESLTSHPDTFGSRCTLSERFLSEICQPQEDGGPGILEQIIRSALGRQQAELLHQVGGSKKSRRQVLSIPKLDDAHNAGSSRSSECTLILTEGDSAKALAVAGLEVIGRQTYGVFPLRGKFLNVRDAPVKQLSGNQEVKAICLILGLDFEKEYATVADRAELRYGHVMLMTDQDTDGSHIKGLMMNFFRHFWPSLLKPTIDGQEDDKPFLSSFITPLLKATRKGRKETKSFYNMAEYNDWRSSLDPENDVSKWNIKYYKGLGTSTPTEAKEYFKAFDSHHRPFSWKSCKDGELLDMVFDKERASDRRDWILSEYDENASLAVDESNSVTYEDFVNKEMIHFSNGDNIRSLPSVIDGLKPSQRKVLFACFKRNLKKEIKVAQLTGYCAEHTAYHHGEASLHSTSKLIRASIC
eukprot:scaffold14122_cov44-Attheya_sp.AAC.3